VLQQCGRPVTTIELANLRMIEASIAYLRKHKLYPYHRD
jgi:hypothetical protein